MIREFSLFNSTKFINRLAYLVGGLAVFVILFSFLYYMAFNWFCVTRVIITGNIHPVTAQQLTSIARERIDGTLFTLNIEKLRTEFNRVPWVKNVVVSREFPNSIIVDVSGYDAMARLGDNGYFVAPDGSIFYGDTDNDFVLPTFYGTTNDLASIIAIYNQSKDIFAKHQVFVSKIYWLGPQITKIVVSNNLLIVLCSHDVAQNLMLLNQYWGQLYQLNPQLNYVNMCYRNKIAINAGSIKIKSK